MSVEGSALSDASKARPRRSWLVFAPLAVFGALAALFLVRLFAGDASRLPSALIGHPVPEFALPALAGSDRPALSAADLRRGKVTLVNVFASWCAPCHGEHGLLVRLAREGWNIAGLAYKDDPGNTLSFLREDGDPYGAIGLDRSGRTGIDFGVYGVPETFVVKGDGTIAYKFIGPLTEESWRDVLKPEVEKAAR